MPKQTKRRGTKQFSQNVQVSESRQNKRLKAVSITIILALVLSLLVGAMSITPTPAIAQGGSSVLSADQEVVDTDGDGVENNADPDVDGDGIVNGEDPDIDGDGIENFDDADPIDTTDVDSNAPEKPIRPAGAGDTFVQATAWIWIGLSTLAATAISLWLLGKRRNK